MKYVIKLKKSEVQPHFRHNPKTGALEPVSGYRRICVNCEKEYGFIEDEELKAVESTHGICPGCMAKIRAKKHRVTEA